MSKASNLAGFAGSISSNNNLNVGIVTASGFVGNVTGNLTGNVTGNLTGNVTGNATGLSGAPNLNVGIVTASSFIGSLTGTASTATAATTAFGLSGSPNVTVGIATINSSLNLNGSYIEDVNAVSALDIDCSAGNYFTKTINTNSTFTVSNVPAVGSYSFTLEVTHTSGSITWFSGVEWPDSSAPTLTTGKTHLFMFVTDNGGSRWRASSLINYVN